MTPPSSPFVRSRGALLAAAALLVVLGVIVWPRASGWLSKRSESLAGDKPGAGPRAHEGQDDGHTHGAHTETSSIELSPQALKNIGFTPLTIALGAYDQTISLPGIVVERPGRSQIRVSAPLTGVVTRIFVIEGEAVEPGAALFELRLTHEDLVGPQTEFLKLAEQLDVVNREIARLESLTEGIVPGKRILDQQYERQKLQAGLKAERQALLLHGLSEQQVDGILQTRKLLQQLTVSAPPHRDDGQPHREHPLHVQKLPVQVGQLVTAGDVLCVLADHCELYIEGTAFEEDAQRLREAAATRGKISVELLLSGEQTPRELTLLYLADQVDVESRAFHFYLKLPNDIVQNRQDGSHRFVQWRFQPGQRVQLQIPVQRFTDKIVVPADAVVVEGPEAFVYQQNGKHFHRVPVHVEYQNRKVAVLANDGSVFPGDVIAGRGAGLIHVALKNKSGGPIDPHAGHHH